MIDQPSPKTIGELFAALPVDGWVDLPEYRVRVRRWPDPFRVDLMPVPSLTEDADTPYGPLSSTEDAPTAPPRGGGCIEPPEALTEADRDAHLIRIAAAAQQEYEDSLTAEYRVAHPEYLGQRIAHAIRPLLDATTNTGGAA